MKRLICHLTLASLAAIALTACGKPSEAPDKPSGPPPTLITVTTAETRNLEILERAIGSLEGLIDPTVGAEVAARVNQVMAHAGQSVKKGELIAVLDGREFDLQRRQAEAEIKRIEALLANQGRLVDRNQRLVQKNFISQNALDDVSTQQAALQEELEAARTRLAAVDLSASKTRIYSPLDGRVEKQVVSVGDFVKVGDPLFQIIGTQRLRAHLPFPEGVAARLSPGQTVRLSTPTAPDDVFSTTIREIKPLIGSTNRAADVIADVVDKAGWYPGASVNAEVVVGQRPQAVVVPEQAVVLRPAGEVVYEIKDRIASQRVVKAGLREQGMVEILQGLSAGQTVAVDGAAFLTDKAAVNIQQPATQGAAR